MKNFNKLVSGAILGSLALCCCCHCCHGSMDTIMDKYGISSSFRTARDRYETTAVNTGNPNKERKDITYTVIIKRLAENETLGYIEIHRERAEWITKEKDNSPGAQFMRLTTFGARSDTITKKHSIDDFTLTFEIENGKEQDQALAKQVFEGLPKYIALEKEGMPPVETLVSLVSDITNSNSVSFFLNSDSTAFNGAGIFGLPGHFYRYEKDSLGGIALGGFREVSAF